jgi:membrane protease YdiL (CAAX protease family)
MTTSKAFVKSHPLLSYFALVFAISSGGLLIAVGREGLPLDARNSWIAALALFAGPSVAGPLMTGLVHGRAGLRELLAQLLRWRVSARWYAVALLTTPLLVIPILLALSLISPLFLPDAFTTEDVVALLLLGLMVGGIGGFSEELGWTGFAVPTLLRPRHGVLTTGLIVGAMWAAWHVPVTFLSTLSPSGGVSWSLLLPPLCFYVAVLPAYRVLMVWVYDRTESLLVAMLMHTSLAASTFVILLPPATGVALIAYYLVLAAVLWVVVGAVALAQGGHLTRQPAQRRVA